MLEQTSNRDILWKDTGLARTGTKPQLGGTDPEPGDTMLLSQCESSSVLGPQAPLYVVIGPFFMLKITLST